MSFRSIVSPFRVGVRRPRPADYDGMAELAGQLGYPCTEKDVRSRVSAMREGSRYAIYVATLDGEQIAGWIGAYVFISVETDPCVEVNGLIVRENLRSHGIGRLLLGAVEAWAERIGSKVVSVRSNVVRCDAHRFYRNNGYQMVKTQRTFQKVLRAE